MNWRTLLYQIPREPQKNRMAVWRKLKSIGALNVLQSIWILPDTKEAEEEFYKQYNFVKTMPHILEIMNKECNKGYGVRALAEKLGIKKDEIICIGDQANDIEMVDYAGLGIAMGNAIGELKDIAQYVTSDNDDGGVAKV